MNVVKRRWPDLLIGLLVLLLLGGFAALLLGKGNGTTGTQTTAPTTPAATTPSTPAPSQAAPTPATTPPAATSTPPAATPTPPAAGTEAGIPTIEAAPVTGNDQAGTTATPSATVQTPGNQTLGNQTPVTAPQVSGSVAPRSAGAVSVSEARTPTRNDYRVSLGKFSDNAAQAAATAGVSGLGYVVHPIPVVSGVVAQVGPFASREQATLALADIQRAYPGALLYPPRNAPSSNSAPAATPTSPAAATPADSSPAAAPQATPAAAAPAAPSGPVYLQVGAFNSSAAAQSAVARVRSLGLEPSVNAPAGKLVTVVVGPFQGQALVSAEAKLQAGGLDSFRVR